MGLTWLLLIFVGVVVLAGLLILVLVLAWPRDGKWAIKLAQINCPRCGALVPRARKPQNQRQALWGGATCAQCGCEMDKHGIEIQDGAK